MVVERNEGASRKRASVPDGPRISQTITYGVMSIRASHGQVEYYVGQVALLFHHASQ